MPSPQSRARSHSRPKLSETPHTDNVVMIMELLLNASVHTPTNSDAKVLGEQFCDLLNMFTLEELKKIKKVDNKFFTLITKLLHAIGDSGTEESRVFMQVCKSKLKATEFLKYEGPPLIRNISGVQEGGAPLKVPGGLMSILCLLIAIFMSYDLLSNPQSATTFAGLCSLIAKLSWGKLEWLTDYLKPRSTTNVLVPVGFVEGSGVVHVSGHDGAQGDAYRDAKRYADNLEADEKRLQAGTEAALTTLVVQSRGAATCFGRKSCPDPETALLGSALTPLIAAEDRRPTLLHAISSNKTVLAGIRGQLVVENRKWRFVGGRNQTLLDELQANATWLEAAIAAYDTTSSLLSSVPGLDNPQAVSTLLAKVSEVTFAQIEVGEGQLPGRVLAFSPHEEKLLYRDPGAKQARKQSTTVGQVQVFRAPPAQGVTTPELTAAGIENAVVDLRELAMTHAGSNLDLAYVQKLGEIPELLRQAVALVPPAGTSVNTKDVGAMVLKFFKADKKADPFKPPYAVFTALALKSANEVATHNLGVAQKQVASSLARIFDSNFHRQREKDAERLADQLVNLGLDRMDAMVESIVAIETSARFAMKPNLDNLDYAHTVFNCFKGLPCPKEKMEDLYERARFEREVRSWSFLKRLDYVKMNLVFVVFSMLGVGVVAEILIDGIPGIVKAGLGSIEAIVGTGRFLGRGARRANNQERANVALQDKMRGKIEAEILRLTNAAVEGNNTAAVASRIRELQALLHGAVAAPPPVAAGPQLRLANGRNNRTRRNGTTGNNRNTSQKRSPKALPTGIAPLPPGALVAFQSAARPPPGSPPRGLVLSKSPTKSVAALNRSMGHPATPPKSPTTKLRELKELAERYKATFPGGGGGAAEGTLTKDQISQLVVEALSLGIDMPKELDGANTTQLTTQRRIVNAIIAHPAAGHI
jgi:hypothetical protein